MQQYDSVPLDQAVRGKLLWLISDPLVGSYLSSRNYDGNIDSDQPLNAERDFFQLSFYRNESGAQSEQFLL